MYSESLLFDGILLILQSGVIAPLKQIMIFTCVNVYCVYTSFVLEIMAEYSSQISDENELFLGINLYLTTKNEQLQGKRSLDFLLSQLLKRHTYLQLNRHMKNLHDRPPILWQIKYKRLQARCNFLPLSTTK